MSPRRTDAVVAGALDGSLELFGLRPPYRAPDPIDTDEALASLASARAPVLALRLRRPPADPARVAEPVRALRRAFPSVPVTLWIDVPVTPAVVRLIQQSGTLRVRAVVLNQVPSADVLRPLLTRPDLAIEVVDWLALLGVRLSPGLQHVLRHLFAHAPRYRSVAEVVAALSESGTGLRGRLRKRTLPSPGRWLHAARALHLALRLQAQPGESQLKLALDFGYADHSGLVHQLRRTFGVTPSTISGTLGWEWLMARWWASEKGRRAGRAADC